MQTPHSHQSACSAAVLWTQIKLCIWRRDRHTVCCCAATVVGLTPEDVCIRIFSLRAACSMTALVKKH